MLNSYRFLNFHGSATLSKDNRASFEVTLNSPDDFNASEFLLLEVLLEGKLQPREVIHRFRVQTSTLRSCSTMATCAVCQGALVSEVGPNDQTEDNETERDFSAFQGYTVPDDVELNCGCHVYCNVKEITRLIVVFYYCRWGRGLHSSHTPGNASWTPTRQWNAPSVHKT